ncbi:MAG: threonylcarbamoyl-AMP synthase [Sphingobium sp.]|nr:threonylcarbamoyl-AMP synthase [Sphingobium sp.]
MTTRPADTPHYETLTLPFGDDAIAQAAHCIANHQPVAVPTETVYGLAADARCDDAVASIYAAKGRPSFNPLIVHVDGMEMASTLAHFGPVAQILAKAFWPGPLTMVLPVREDAGLSPLVMAGLPTVAIRCPAHRAMQALITKSGAPLAAPSANRSGSISPSTAAHVERSLGGRIPLIIDDGATEKGLESTIVAPEQDRIRLLRPGPVTPDMLTAATGLAVLTSEGGSIEAPGQMTSHYAPSKPVRLNATHAASDEYMIGFGEIKGDISLSEHGDPVEAAARLFAVLHHADAAPAPRIAIAPIPTDGIGLAINDRLKRAAA